MVTTVPTRSLETISICPPSSSARSATPLRPNWFVVFTCLGLNPRPLSSTLTVTQPSRRHNLTVATVALAWRTTLVSNSCAMR